MIGRSRRTTRQEDPISGDQSAPGVPLAQVPEWHELGAYVDAVVVPGRLIRFGSDRLPDVLASDRGSLLSAAEITLSQFGRTAMGKKI